MKWLPLIALFFVSCGSDPVSQPFVASSLNQTAVQVSPPKVVPDLVVEEPEVKRKILAGKVTFTDLTEQELGEFRVIPEEGNKLFTPENGTYDQVDGLWWRGAESGKWLKIPGASRAWVGKKPEKFDGIAREGELEVYYRSGVIVGVANFLKKTVKHPAWFENAGLTMSPVASPWVTP